VNELKNQLKVLRVENLELEAKLRVVEAGGAGEE
jgi:hypothetical protein